MLAFQFTDVNANVYEKYQKCVVDLKEETGKWVAGIGFMFRDRQGTTNIVNLSKEYCFIIKL